MTHEPAAATRYVNIFDADGVLARDNREIHWKPYRIIYRLERNAVYVLLIVDGRRDMRSLLQRRLLEA